VTANVSGPYKSPRDKRRWSPTKENIPNKRGIGRTSCRTPKKETTGRFQKWASCSKARRLTFEGKGSLRRAAKAHLNLRGVKSDQGQRRSYTSETDCLLWKRSSRSEGKKSMPPDPPTVGSVVESFRESMKTKSQGKRLATLCSTGVHWGKRKKVNSFESLQGREFPFCK